MRAPRRFFHLIGPVVMLACSVVLCRGEETPAPSHPDSKEKEVPGPAIEFQLPPSTNRINLLDTNHPPLQPRPEAGPKADKNEKAEALAKQIESQAETNAALTNSPLMNQVQRHSSDLPESQNIVTERPASSSQQIKNYELKLQAAHEARKIKDYETAENSLLYILDGRAPDNLKGDALLEYASLCIEQKQLPRAQQLYAQWVRKFPEHPDMPEVLLRQGLVYRDMGAPEMAKTKFFSVMSASLALKWDRLDYYKKMVLRAQTEIADTYYFQGNYTDAVGKYLLLLKPNNPDIIHLNREAILFKLIRSLSLLQRYPEVVAQSEVFVHDFPDAAEQAEVRYTMASALKKMGRDEESIQQTMLLLQSQKNNAPEKWRYWQQRAGNDIANQLFQQGDYLNALTVYKKLADLDTAITWQLPVFYQIGLIYEQLKQPEKAMDCYKAITSREKEINVANPNPNMTTVLEMARFRMNRISWELKADRVERDLTPAVSDDKTAAAAP